MPKSLSEYGALRYTDVPRGDRWTRLSAVERDRVVQEYRAEVQRRSKFSQVLRQLFGSCA